MVPGRVAANPSVYIHIPFCAKKCAYCAFYSAKGNREQMDRFVAALCAELQRAPDRGAPPTIFFGGGTPSLLTVAHWEQVLDALDARGWFGGGPEVTIECNPATVSREKAQLWVERGVNRVSMGVQSMDTALLDKLGRIHSRESVFKSYDLFREVGFTNVNLDLMFAIPGQTMEIWDQTLNEILALEPEHLASYEVIYEEDTDLYHQLTAGEFSVDEALAEAQFFRLLERLDGAGYRQYEVANFARSHQDDSDEAPGLACRHNVNYWEGGEYQAFGPSASGHLDGRRFQNLSHTDGYIELMEAGQEPVEYLDPLSPRGRAGEIAAFGLRMNRGWTFERFTRRTGFRLETDWADTLETLTRRGWGEASATGFRLTSEGLRFADAAGAEFLEV